MTAVGLDSNDYVYLIAYAIVQKENISAWQWFLKKDISIGHGIGWTLMMDRRKGLQNVIEELFPETEYRLSIRLMYTIFFNVG